MKLFALETDEQKLIQGFLSHDEQVVMTVNFSVFLFIIRSIRAFFLTLILVAIGVAVTQFGAPVSWTVLILFCLWFVWIFLRWVTAYIDWRYDVLLVTTEEIVIVDQSSLFRVKIRQMNLDNIASVMAETQFLNLFPFGRLQFELKEGTGKTLVLPYIPHANRVASVISDAMVVFQRRRMAAGHAIAHGVSPQQAEKIAEKAAPVGAPMEVTDGKKPQ